MDSYQVQANVVYAAVFVCLIFTLFVCIVVVMTKEARCQSHRSSEREKSLIARLGDRDAIIARLKEANKNMRRQLSKGLSSEADFS